MPNRNTVDNPASAPLPAEKLLSRVAGSPVTITPRHPTSHRTLDSEIGKVLDTLREREAHVLRRRFGLEDGQERTLEEIGVSLNISRERVHQIEEKALRKLRHPTRLGALEALFEVNRTSEFASDAATARRPRLVTKPGSYLDEVRKSHPRAYKAWSPEEEQQLASLFQTGQSIQEIASILERRPSAIRSRLRRSGLIPTDLDRSSERNSNQGNRSVTTTKSASDERLVARIIQEMEDQPQAKMLLLQTLLTEEFQLLPSKSDHLEDTMGSQHHHQGPGRSLHTNPHL